jgi:hypothetical protein
MKKFILLFLISVCTAFHTKAQYVKIRPGFPSGVVVRAPGVAPFAGGVWIGPEWKWQGGRYVHTPGYWAKPHRRGLVWVPGHWKYTRRGYVWRPGRWR